MPEKRADILRIILTLSKVKITVAVSFTTITGYVLANGSFDKCMIAVTLGIFLLACSSSVINHIQESRTDAAMSRTKNRPIPGGDVKPSNALILAGAEWLAGSLILLLYVNGTALILGWAAMIWYNLVYTNLKRVTAHAVIPGSVIGAIPPLAGWAAAEVSLTDVRAWSMALFFFSWQVPHFYLLVLKYGPQYEQAGLPALTSYYNSFLMRLMIFLWIVTTSLAALLMYYFHVVRSAVTGICLLLFSLWLVVVFFIPLVRQKSDFSPFGYFMKINYYVLAVIIVLNLDHLFFRYLV
ncbi:MAG: protoheme IX farnesyltransferase [Bacteroidales bacterium]|jgi:protoheme IX farnesyltransferase